MTAGMSKVFPPSQYDAAIEAADQEFCRLRYLRGCERKQLAWSASELRAAQSQRAIVRQRKKV